MKPNPTPTATTTASKTVIITNPDRIGPNRMANRLAGVTRNRSMSPDCSSKMVPKPALAPLAKASRARIPGRNSSRTLAGGEPRDAREVLQQWGEEHQIEHGVENPTNSHTGLRSIWTV